MAAMDLTNQVYGKWTVLEKDTTYKGKNTRWLCRCSCGNPEIRSVQAGHLRSGASKSCGKCYHYEMIGKRFGRVVVLEEDFNYKKEHKIKTTNSYFKVQCDCGTIFTTNGTSLVQGDTKSCGCYQKEDVAKRLSVDLTNKIFGSLKALYPKAERKNNHIVWCCKCVNCGKEYEISTNHLQENSYPLCECLGRISKGELEITQILEENNIKFEKEKIFEDLINPKTNKFYRYDFYLPDYNLLIEFDGELHYFYTNNGWNNEENYNKIKQSDQIKNNYAKSHNINLVRIPYWERDKITLDLLLNNKYLI